MNLIFTCQRATHRKVVPGRGRPGSFSMNSRRTRVSPSPQRQTDPNSTADRFPRLGIDSRFVAASRRPQFYHGVTAKPGEKNPLGKCSILLSSKTSYSLAAHTLGVQERRSIRPSFLPSRPVTTILRPSGRRSARTKCTYIYTYAKALRFTRPPSKLQPVYGAAALPAAAD